MRTKKQVIKELLEVGIWNIDKTDSIGHLESLLAIVKEQLKKNKEKMVKIKKR